MFLKKFSIPNNRRLGVQQRCFFTFLAFSPKQLLRIFLIFCMGVEGNRAHCLSQVVFLKNFLIPNYRRLGVQKSVFDFFGLFSQTALKIFLNFCMSVVENRAHRFSQMFFLKKFSIIDYKGLSVQKGVFLTFLTFSLKNTLGILLSICISVTIWPIVWVRWFLWKYS